jgi:transposase
MLEPDIKLVGEQPMRKPIPPIAETVDELKQRLRQERNVHKQQRLQMLYLLASGQAHERQQVADLLGVHRNTIGRWLAIYAASGLDALLDIYVASGKPLSLPPDVLSSIEQALHQQAGFASYQALRQWVHQTHQIEVKYKTLYTIVRTRFKTKLKVPRPSHTKKS